MDFNSIVNWELYHELRGTPTIIKVEKIKDNLREYLPPINEVLEFYRKLYIGKEFVYKSKHGSHTIGFVKDIKVRVDTVFDKYTEKELRSGIIEHYLDDFEYKKKYSAYKIVVSIVSNNDVNYGLDEVYIIF